ncbi:flippase [Comamonas sp.]|uniref:flippase n=1 Tax=Comamonas sp. TaxID=34028 RepID=UPI0012D12F97|nr:flippase [Comamonas sp.]MPS95020.1 flippase [Comamonas sp.]
MSIKKNTIWNLVGAGVPLIFAAFSIPYVISKIGVERFGILTIVWVLIGYFSLFDFGLGRALTQRISSALAKGEEQKIPEITFNGVIFTLLTGILGGSLLACFAYPLAYLWLNISTPLQTDAFWSFLWTTFGIILTTVSNGFRGVLEAYEDFRSASILKIFLGVANFVTPALSVIFFGTNVSTMALILVLSRLLVAFFYFLQVRRTVEVGWRMQKLSLQTIRDMLSFGAWMTVSNTISPIMVNFDRFFISNVLGGSMVAFYTVPFEIITRILILPTALSTTLFPRFTATLQNNKMEAKNIYISSFNLTALTLGVVCLIGAFCANFGLKIWVGEEFAEKSTLVSWILLAGVFFNGVAMVPFSLIQANGSAKGIAKIHLLELVLYVPLLILMIHKAAIVGAAAAWTMRVVFDFILLSIFAKKILK